VWLCMPDGFRSFFNGYEARPYTLSERLLTEPRIVLYYLSQIFYPIPTRLSIEHDVVISTSLFQPWTTLPAILLTLLTIGFAIMQVHKRPLIALAILFFFLNHIIESTVFPLELIFEHRNYLPSMFLFLPLAVGFKWLYDYYSIHNRNLSSALTGFLILLFACLGTATYIRNSIWATEFSLWQDAMGKAPQSARPLANLAWQLAYGPEARPSQYELALKLYDKALYLQKPRSFSEPIIMNNMAGIYFKKEEHQKAIDLLEKALTISPAYARGRHDLVRILVANGKWNMASEHIDYLLAKHDTHEGYLNLKGLILLHQKKYAEAVNYFRKALTAAPFFKDALMNVGVAYSLNGDYRNADVFLWRAHRVRPRNMLPLLGLIENNLRAGDVLQAKAYADDLISFYKMSAVKNQLLDISANNLLPPLSPELILGAMESPALGNSAEISITPN
ncbi:MAG: tetratricopeptide repeat protein, partial [Deltaproteobacteria bacterium]|nr:tetratricopeptide repeat protein [Deltaproteobacteria bacterium]